MKRLGLYILLISFVVACQKEDDITPGIGYENLYVIQDDPNDPVQHKRYELYQTYGVPVFFNDTIGKVFVKIDINGDSIFHYEVLDLNWTFNDDNSSSVTYQVTRLTDPDLQMKALRFAEIYLENSQPALHPYAMWLTEKCYELSSAGVVEKGIITRYRNLMFSWIEKMKDADMLKTANSYQKEVMKLKVQNYTEQLNAFNKITDERYYGAQWSELYPDFIPAYDMPIYDFTRALQEEWEGNYSYRNDLKTYGNYMNPDWPQGVWNDEQVDAYIAHIRGMVGAYGFVSYQPGDRYFAPKDTEVDLSLYLEEMMKYPREEFLERWESSALVIKKYEVLYSIIKEELGVEL